MRDIMRTRWAAIGAAVAVTLGAGGVSLTQAALTTGDKPVYIALAEPCRLVDTRPASTIGAKNTPIAAGDAGVYEIQVSGDSGNCTGTLAVPADATAVATNVTAIAPVATTTGRSFFTVYPGDAARPTTSNLNFLNGAPPVPNKVDVGLSATGTIKIYNNEGTAHAAVDVFGYYIDHHHDDRYYTEPEVDARFAPLSVANPATLTIAGITFQPTNSSLEYSASGGAVYATGLLPAGGYSFTTALGLPPGAAITQVTFYVVDNNAADMGLSLRSYDPEAATYQVLRSATSTGATNSLQTIVVPVDPPIVVDGANSYLLRVAPGVASSTHLLRGARVEYTVPAVLP